jgi:hypothetical protein
MSTTKRNPKKRIVVVFVLVLVIIGAVSFTIYWQVSSQEPEIPDNVILDIPLSGWENYASISEFKSTETYLSVESMTKPQYIRLDIDDTIIMIGYIFEIDIKITKDYPEFSSKKNYVAVIFANDYEGLAWIYTEDVLSGSYEFIRTFTTTNVVISFFYPVEFIITRMQVLDPNI